MNSICSLLKDPTKNHHYVSQVEQRLNAWNPNAQPRNQKIYAFNVIDRDNINVKLKSDRGEGIESNLRCLDLYSFEVFDDEQRLNLERAFKKYENKARVYTRSLLEKINGGRSDIKEEVLELFALKHLNILRNPYNIHLTLEVLENLSNLEPADDITRRFYRKVEIYDFPQARRIQEEYAISIESYRSWIKALFLLLVPADMEKNNILELFVKELFESSREINIHVYDCSGVSNAHPLLSDRGFASAPRVEQDSLNYCFNLSSDAFICYDFRGAGVVEAEKGKHQSKANVMRVNDKNSVSTALSVYNENVIRQCFDTVFCKSKKIYGLGNKSA
ncbi:hypothetical protein [Microbulbifer sp. SSSA005]|uniref:hypothetical protein n=1 Tax=Microbulbifer sp. SSSA005 TaxID=3243378 RepID=UPI00403962E2